MAARKGWLGFWACFLLWQVVSFILARPNASFGSGIVASIMLFPGDFIASRLSVVRAYAQSFYVAIFLINALAWYLGMRLVILLARSIRRFATQL